MTEPSDSPFDRNEHGLWCPAFGYLVATNEMLEEPKYQAPEECKQCGFPDFEDGMGYFTDD